MAKRRYEDRLKNLNTWVEITNYHWDRLNGEFYDDQQAWDDTYHAFANDDWWDMVESADTICQVYDHCFKPGDLYKFRDDIKEINRRLMFGKTVVKPKQKSYNFHPFRGWMILKDVLNSANGTPTKEFDKKTPPDEDPTQFERLFDF